MGRAMTSKERLLCALKKGKPDRLPVSVHQWQGYHLEKYLGGASALEAFARFGMDAQIQYFQDMGQFWMAQGDSWQGSTVQWRDEVVVVRDDGVVEEAAGEAARKRLAAHGGRAASSEPGRWESREPSSPSAVADALKRAGLKRGK
jgi:hypothetical protein